MIPAPAALVVAHPGHELRLHRWLELARPHVFVITDGSGSGRPRIHATLKILGATGCTPGSIMPATTDGEIYRALLGGDVDRVAAMTIELANRFVEHDIRSVVADACEFYNPTHDLCSVMAGLAAELSGRKLARYDYAVTEAPFGEGEIFALDDAALARKLAAADRCEDLRLEVGSLIDRIGIDALRHEVLRPVTTPARPVARPFYETHGESRVASGHYSTVIRYEEHFVPFVDKLTATVHGAATQHAWQS